MKTLSKTQLLIVISLIVAKCWSLQRQFSTDGALSVILFATIALLAIAALLRRSTALAFVLAVGSAMSAFTLARTYLFAPTHSLPSILLFTRGEAVYLTLAYCLFALWAEWRRAEELTPARF